MRLAYLHYLCEDDTALHHVRQFTAAARSLGHTVQVHALNLAPSEGGGHPTRRFLKRRLSRYLHEPKELLWNLRYRRRELGLLREQRPEVLLVRNSPLIGSFASAAKRLRLPLVVEVNEPAIESRLYFDEYWHLPWAAEGLESWKLGKADRVVTVSSALRDYLVERHRLPEEKFVVVPNGVDVAKFPEIDRAERAEQADGGVTVGFVGSFQKFHGIDVLAEMTRRLAATRPRVEFVYVGDGPELDLLRAVAADLGERVSFTGSVPHERVPELVAGFDVAVLPDTAFYCSPLKIFEWMASSCAVVAPGYGPLQDIIRDGVDGLLFPPGEVEVLVGHVTRLADDAGLRRRLGRSAAQRARSEFTWERNAELVVGACQAALDAAG